MFNRLGATLILVLLMVNLPIPAFKTSVDSSLAVGDLQHNQTTLESDAERARAQRSPSTLPLPADNNVGRIADASSQTNWWMVDRWSWPTQMFGSYIAVDNTIHGLSSGDWIAAVPLNVAYGSATDFVWFQLGIFFNADQATPYLDLQNNVWRTGMSVLQFNHNRITDPAYVTGHEYSFTLTTPNANIATFTLLDRTTAKSWQKDFTIPSNILLIDPVVQPTGGIAFSPASAVEGLTSANQVTEVPFFQFSVANNIQGFVFREPITPPSGIDISQIRIGVSDVWYWEMLTPTDLPSPRILTPVEYPSYIGMGQVATIEVDATNDGATAIWQTVAITFPEGQSVSGVSIIRDDFGNAAIHSPGEVVHASYSLVTRTLTQYLVEGSARWLIGEERGLEISVQPQFLGSFRFCVKTVASAADWACIWDPDSGDLDQQSEFVKTYTINVGVNPSTITANVSPDTIYLGSGTTISGTIASSVLGDKSGTVYLEYSTDNVNWNAIGSTASSSLGDYSYWWTPSITGTFYVHSYWNGNVNYGGATSSSVTLSVTSAAGNLGDHTMCENVQSSYPWDPIGRTNTFYTDDAAAYSWVEFENIYSPSHTIHWYWYDPDGACFFDYAYTIPDPGAGYYYPSYRASCYTSINGYQSWFASKLGRPFLTAVFYDGSLATTETWQVIKHGSSISLSLSSSSVTIGQSTMLTSQLSPPLSDGITAFQSSMDGITWVQIAGGTCPNGYYSFAWIPPAASTYYLRSTWNPDTNLNYYGSTSSVQTLTVNRQLTSLTTSLSSSEITYGSSVTITASMSPALHGKSVTIEYSFDSSTWYYLDSGSTDSAGQYSYSWIPAAGTYYLLSSWTGDNNYYGTTSFSQTLVVNASHIYIRSDGSVDPPAAPLQKNGNQYILTADINSFAGIVIETSNIVLDGAGHFIQGSGVEYGFNLTSINHVTIRNTIIINFDTGIYLYSSSYNSVSGNQICYNIACGIYLFSSSNNVVLGNSIHNNEYGIMLFSSDINILSDNDMAVHAQDGIYISSSYDNVVSGNNITMSYNGIHIIFSASSSVLGNKVMANHYGIFLDSSSNSVYHNSFISNTIQGYSYRGANVWDDGYPSGGNYWSDYAGVDSNGDGIWDSPYILYSNDPVPHLSVQDNYPLVNPWARAAVHLLLTEDPTLATYAEGQSVTLTVDVLNQLNPSLKSTLTLTITGPKGYYYFDFQSIHVKADAVGEYCFTWNVPAVAGTYVVEVSLVPLRLTAYDAAWLEVA